MLLRSVLCVLAAIAVAYCQAPPPNIVTPNRDPEDYALTFCDPPGCNVDDCIYFSGIDINAGNPDYLDIYIEGNAGAWVALGFSDTPSMFSADVLACNINGATVEVLDAWNLAATARGNIVDTVQDVFQFSGDLINGRISCSFARLISGSDTVPVEDLDLSQDYFVLYGRNGDGGGSPGSITPHDIGPGNPNVSPTRVNAASLTVMMSGVPLQLPPTVVVPERELEDYRIRARTPAGCEPSSCDIFVGIDNNNDTDFLDVYMEGRGGWLAVGFTRSANMFDADVLACNLDPATGMVEVLDGWNVGSPGRNSVPDSFFDVGIFSTSIEDRRIKCTFARRIMGTDVGTNDFNLNEEFFILYGRSPDNSASGQLVQHRTGSGNPFVSPSRVNPETDTADIAVDRSVQERLTRAHGILMIIAWPLMAVTAIFFAAWMRPALPNGEWFQVHRGFMIASLFIGTVGFILIFVAQYNRSTPGLINLGEGFETETAHFVLGIVVMTLHIANPIIAIFRCHPGTPNRWLFNLLHGSIIGIAAEILALINVGIGLSLFGEGFSRFLDLTIFYIYLSWEMFLLVMILVLFLVFTILAATSDEEDRKKLAPSLTKILVRNNGGSGQNVEKSPGVELAVPGEKPPPDPPADQRKPPSRDSPLRWAAFIVFGIVTIPFMLVLIILVALPQ